MWHSEGLDAITADAMWALDLQLAEAVHQAGCSRCGARLHRADYARKPRGVPDELKPRFSSRLSFCCAAEGCRKRSTPPSVRFLGPKVFVGLAVLVASVLAQAFGAAIAARRTADTPGTRTVRRWLGWWRDLVWTPFWREARGFLPATIDASALPASLLALLPGEEGPLWMLRLLAPLSTGSVEARISMVT
jgi:hypothetical protein